MNQKYFLWQPKVSAGEWHAEAIGSWLGWVSNVFVLLCVFVTWWFH